MIMPDVKFSASVRVMDDAKDVDIGGGVELEGTHKLREVMADKLMKAKMQTIRGSHHTEFRFDLFVFTPDEFAKVIHEQAAILAKRLYR